jgi:hypothetical protein
VFAIADSVPVIFKNHGIRVRGGIGFSVNSVARLLASISLERLLLTMKTEETPPSSQQIRITRSMSNSRLKDPEEGEIMNGKDQQLNVPVAVVDASLDDRQLSTTFKSASLDEDDDCLHVEGIKFLNYTDESQLGDIMRLVGKDLSEPYSSESLARGNFYFLYLHLQFDQVAEFNFYGQLSLVIALLSLHISVLSSTLAKSLFNSKLGTYRFL